MAFENSDSIEPMQLFDQYPRLADTSAVVWFLGFGAGCATGLALAYALFAIWSGARMWIAITAASIALVHASIMVAFWLNKEVVRRRTAIMVSMIASAILTGSLAWIGAKELQTTPLYGLALMHLIMAFSHPAVLPPTKQ